MFKTSDSQDIELARRKLARLDRSFSHTADQFLANSRWLTASLLAVNSAGSAAVLGAAKDHPAAIAPGFVFVAGLVFAMLGAVAIQELAGRALPHIRALDDYWTGVSLGGPRDVGIEAELDGKLARAYRFSPLAPALGWLSGLLFVIGAAWLLVALRG